MDSLNAARDPEAEDRDAIRIGLRNALNVITGRTQLLQRQILRADGLLNLERNLILDGLAATLDDVRRMGLHLEDLLVEKDSPAGPLAASPMERPEVMVVVWDEPSNAPTQDQASAPD